MAEGGNYSFSSHNLRTPAMRQSFNRPAKLLQHRQLQTPENRLGTSSVNADGSQTDTSLTVKKGNPQSVKFVPHPPSSRRSSAGDVSPRVAALNSKGVKRSRHESPLNSPSGSEDERRIHKHVLNVVLDPLPLRRSGSTGSLDSMGSSESLSSPRNRSKSNRNLRGVEPLKDISSDKELIKNFKSYQSSAKKDDSSKRILKKNVVHPFSATPEQNDSEEDICERKETTPVKSNSEQSVLINNKPPSEDEVTLSSSNDSLTSVSDSEENSISNSDTSESKNHGKPVQRHPNSTLPTLPSQLNDRTLAGNSSGLYESIHPNEHNQDEARNNSTSDLRNLSKALEQVATNDERYASDTDLSVRSTGQASNVSTLSILPRVSARRARTRSGNFLKEEMERYFPDGQIGIFVATWNMHEEKVKYIDKIIIIGASTQLT